MLRYLIDRVEHKWIKVFENWLDLLDRFILILSSNIVPYLKLHSELLFQELKQGVGGLGLELRELPFVVIHARRILSVANLIVLENQIYLLPHVGGELFVELRTPCFCHHLV